MFMTRPLTRIPTATLFVLLGDGQIMASSYRRSRVERFWPCGCIATYAFDRDDQAEWTACDLHAELPQTLAELDESATGSRTG